MASAPTNPVVHLELHTPDVIAACEFYRRLCGWDPERIDPGYERYRASKSATRSAAASSSAPPPRPTWMPYVRVGSVESATERARELGAAVLLEPREGPAGWRSAVASPAGGEMAFWQPTR